MITSIAAICIVVSDQERALAYYRDILGFDARMDNVMENGMRFLVVAPPGGESGVVLYPAGDDVQAGGSFGSVFATENCQATHAELAGRGVDFSEEPTVQEWGGIQAQFHDPDGNHFVLIELPEHMQGGQPQ
jgi:catechol 2,3-dioxygenase-like lactoylglutathione lyase family enzyme